MYCELGTRIADSKQGVFVTQNANTSEPLFSDILYVPTYINTYIRNIKDNTGL